MQVTLELSYYLFLALGILFVLVYFLNIEFFYKDKYYKKIINSSPNIVILRNKTDIIEVNKTFFEYFQDFTSVEDFSKKHKCISEFFAVEEGCFEPLKEDKLWIDYLTPQQDAKYKVKMDINNEAYYFLVSASRIDDRRGAFGIILSDITEQEKSKKALELLSINDPLTNIGNRRFFDQKVHEHLTLTQRYNYPFSFMIFDIDFFKKINDMYGHDVGDKVLIDFTNLIKNNLREGDVFARVGGEEFAVLLPSTTKDKAYTLAQNIRVLIEECKGITPITTSVGLIQYEKGDDEKSIFKRADFALYKAKESGRNKVVLG